MPTGLMAQSQASAAGAGNDLDAPRDPLHLDGPLARVGIFGGEMDGSEERRGGT